MKKTTPRQGQTKKTAGKKAAIGPKSKRVQFAYTAPEARQVTVTGTFCDWGEGFPLKKDSKGVWKTTRNLPPGRYEYRYCVDGSWHNDPRAEERVPNPYGGENDILTVPSKS